MKTNSEKSCPQCGAALASDAPAGLCPACLMQMQLATPTMMNEDGSTHQVRFEIPALEEIIPLFPQLEILELLGKGGMGVVYKARQKELDRVVALKILPREIGETAGFAERFAREARALGKLNHPNIVTLYQFGHVDAAGEEPLYYFLMEYVDGLNLRQLLNNGRIEAREALAIVPQICDALQYAHDQGIVHRDIKPENILMDRRGSVKVADFGLAKIVEGGDGPPGLPAKGRDGSTSRPEKPDLTEAGKVMGTPKYMSPEQVKAPGAVDHRADIYALGVVFYQMLTGEMPGDQLQPPSKKVRIDVRLDEVVLRALEQEPERRYQQASVLKTQVETIVSSGGAEQGTADQAVRFSRTAIVGAVWALFVLGLIPMISVRSISAGEYTGPAWWQITLSILLIPTGLSAPFGTTILGWIAVAKIRRSQGRLNGLGLALFDGLLFPLLLLDIFILQSGFFVIEQSGYEYSLLVLRFLQMLPIGLMALVDGFIIRRVWRAVKGVPAEPSPSAGRKRRLAYAVAALLAAAVAISVWALRSPGEIEVLNTGEQHMAVSVVGTGRTMELGQHGAAAFSTRETIQVGEARIEAGRRIKVTNTGAEYTEIDSGTGTVMTLGPGGTAWFDRPAQLRIGHAVVYVRNNRRDTAAYAPEQLSRRPELLREAPTEKVIAAGLAEINRPWAWQELERRAEGGRLTPGQIDGLVGSLCAHLERDYPQGYDDPLFRLGDLLNRLSAEKQLSPEQQLRVATAVYGAPELKPVPRVRQGEKSVQLNLQYSSIHHDQLFGLILLNHLKSITVNGEPVEFDPPQHPVHPRNQESTAGVSLPALPPGEYPIEIRVESALVPYPAVAALNARATTVDWPPAEKRWTRRGGGTLRVYGPEEPMVQAVEDPQLDPVQRGGLSVASVNINSTKGGMLLIASADIKVGKLPLPVSSDVLLTIDGKTHACGRLWAYSHGNRFNYSGTEIKLELPSLPPSVKTATLTLRPNPKHLERNSDVDQVWGREIEFRNIPVVRYDRYAADGGVAAIHSSMGSGFRPSAPFTMAEYEEVSRQITAVHEAWRRSRPRMDSADEPYKVYLVVDTDVPAIWIERDSEIDPENYCRLPEDFEWEISHVTPEGTSRLASPVRLKQRGDSSRENSLQEMIFIHAFGPGGGMNFTLTDSSISSEWGLASNWTAAFDSPRTASDPDDRSFVVSPEEQEAAVKSGDQSIPASVLLQFRAASLAPGPGLTAMRAPGKTEPVYVSAQALLSDADVASAAVVDGPNGPQISVTFTEAGRRRFADLTAIHIDQPLAILVEGELVSAPIIKSEIPGGTALIAGSFSEAEARRIAEGLNAARPVLIELSADGGLSIGGTSVSQEQLPERLKRLALAGTDTVELHAAKEATHRQVIETMTACQKAGIETVSLAVKKEKEMPPSDEETGRQLQARLDAARKMTYASEKDGSLAAIAVDAGRCRNVEIALAALKEMTYSNAKDSAAVECADRFIAHGMLAEASRIADTITYSSSKDAVLRRIAQGPPARNSSDDRLQRAAAAASNLVVAVQCFAIEIGRYPTEQEGLGALLKNPGIAGWNGPYVKPETGLADPWGTAFELTVRGEGGFLISSAGPDRQFGTDDDIRAGAER